MELDGKLALVTGSSRGIGAAIARRFAEEGAMVVVHGRDSEALDQVRNGIEASGGRSVSLTADVTKPDEIDAMKAKIESEWGNFEILLPMPAEVSPVPLSLRTSI